MTNRNHTDRELDSAASDIAAMMPHRAPRFISMMHDAIDRYFEEGDPARPLTDADRLALADRIIDLKF